MRVLADDSKVFGGSFLLAIAIELLAVATLSSLFMNHNTPHASESGYVEADLVQSLPEPEHLVSQTAKPAAEEVAISKTPNAGRAAKPNENPFSTDNQTVKGEVLPPSHGPIVVSSPKPVIPPYLRDQNFKTSVVIDFLVSESGNAETRLIGSSGNEELDAIALKTAKTWQFRPAEKDHHPLAAKVRLRIVFEVQ